MAKRRIEDSTTESTVTTIKSSDIGDLEDDNEREEVIDSSSAENSMSVDDAPAVVHNAPLSSAAFRAELVASLTDYFSTTERHVRAIRSMCAGNGASLSVDYAEMAARSTALENDPVAFIAALGDALTAATGRLFPGYHAIRPRIAGRIINLPVTEALRDLRNTHLNRLVRVRGIVTRRTGVFAELRTAWMICTKCRARVGPFAGPKVPRPTSCYECQCNGPFLIDTATSEYRDWQRACLQEVPGTVPAGALPRRIELLLNDDLVDSIRPGDEVDAIGVFCHCTENSFTGFPVFSTRLEITSITCNTDTSVTLNSSDITIIKALAKEPNIVERLANALAPSVCGCMKSKKALLLAIVGGVQKTRGSLNIRGDINVLLVGDPGTAKSQLLRCAAMAAPRSVHATGQGASSAGLTASVRRDSSLNEWVLEGGALVLADGGVCAIDEFDKMGDTDRAAIHEAMEQQRISIAKAGIVASLHARCSVIAAANPARGSYNPSLTFSQNVALGEAIVSRFDLLIVVRDIVDRADDRVTATFITQSHSNTNAASSIPFDILKKYIIYARGIRPVIEDIDSRKIAQVYGELRKETKGSGVPITVRHVESIIRLSEAHAKLRLSSRVSREDIDAGISVALESFLGAQKLSIAKTLRKKFARFFDENSDDLALFVLRQMATEAAAAGAPLPSRHDFVGRCRNSGVSITDRFFSSEVFSSAGFSLAGEQISRV